jgi:nitrogen regulatory protein P-II 1
MLFLEKSIEAILESAYTGMVGDGKIFVSDIQETYRIRTKKRELTLANSLIN